MTALLRALPQWGWPAALFARRDALLLTLWVAGATPTFLAGLTAADITVTSERALAIRGLPRSLPATDDPAICPACIWLRWRPDHARIARFNPVRRLKDLLGTRDSDQPPGDGHHRCARTLPAPAADRTAGTALFPAPDQWGNALTINTPAATDRGLRGILAAHRDHHPPIRDAEIIRPQPPPAASAPVQPPPPPRDPDATARRQAAHAAALADLDDATTRLDEIAETADQINTIHDLITIATNDLATTHTSKPRA